MTKEKYTDIYVASVLNGIAHAGTQENRFNFVIISYPTKLITVPKTFHKPSRGRIIVSRLHPKWYERKKWYARIKNVRG